MTVKKLAPYFIRHGRLNSLLCQCLLDANYEFARAFNMRYCVVTGFHSIPLVINNRVITVPLEWLRQARDSRAYPAIVAAILTGYVRQHDPHGRNRSRRKSPFTPAWL